MFAIPQLATFATVRLHTTDVKQRRCNAGRHSLASNATIASLNGPNHHFTATRRELLFSAGLTFGLGARDAGSAGAAELIQQIASAVPLPEKVFVAGATGETGRRVVQQLRAAGVTVVAGVRSVDKAKKLGLDTTGAILVKSDVLDGVDALAKSIGDASAVICCVSFAPSFNFGKDNPSKVDGQGTVDLINASKKAGVTKFVLLSSLLTNAPAVGQSENPNYKFLNALGGILDQKRVAEVYLEKSGLDYTIVRPGGLSSEPPSAFGAVIFRGADQLLGLDNDPGREISRDTVAEVCIQALADTDSKGRILEIVTANDKSTKPVPKDEWY